MNPRTDTRINPIIAEETQLGIESTVEEKIKRLQAAGIGGFGVGTTLGVGSAVTQQANETNVALVEDAVKEKQSIQTLAKEINDDAANDYKIKYDASNNGVQEISEDELVASGYDIELNKLEVIATLEIPDVLFEVFQSYVV